MPAAPASESRSDAPSGAPEAAGPPAADVALAPGLPRTVGGWARMLLELSKARITFAVTFSVATGWILFTGSLDAALLIPALGVFLVACGSATINHVQDHRVDVQMPRTAKRPIPSGRITPTGALVVAVLFLVAGLNVLSYVQHHVWIVLGLGAFSVVFYNGIYYALKRLTAFAVVPGALIGAIPPLLGWSAAGGILADGRILEVAGFFWIWQIPHFWLLMHMYGKQYEGAGLPSPTSMLAPASFKRITVVWTFLTIVSGLLLTLTQRLQLPWNGMGLLAALAIAWAAIGYVRLDPTAKDARRFFMQLNLYALGMMLLLMANALSR